MQDEDLSVRSNEQKSQDQPVAQIVDSAHQSQPQHVRRNNAVKRTPGFQGRVLEP